MHMKRDGWGEIEAPTENNKKQQRKDIKRETLKSIEKKETDTHTRE